MLLPSLCEYGTFVQNKVLEFDEKGRNRKKHLVDFKCFFFREISMEKVSYPWQSSISDGLESPCYSYYLIKVPKQKLSRDKKF